MVPFASRIVAAFLLALCAFAFPAHAAKRLALVIGIDAYKDVPALQKAVGDARAMAAALKNDLGFDRVLAAENLARAAFVQKLAEFDVLIEPGDTVVFFFAGHGIALGGENILLPADVPKPRAGEEEIVRDSGFSVDGIVRRLQRRGAKVSLLVLDACRDNPFEQAGVRNIGTSRGLVRPDTPQGVFMLFSAGIGQTALDSLPGRDTVATSVFTRHLIPALQTPGLSLVQIAKRVQKDVDATARGARHAQQPAYYDQIIGEVVLKSGIVAVAAAMPVPAPPVIKQLTPPGPRFGSRDMIRYTVFRDCPNCPEMVVVPEGKFFMGSPPNEPGHVADEGPMRAVSIASPFAVGKFAVTFAEWEVCVAARGCTHVPNDRGWGRGRRPVIDVSWEDAKQYAAWLAKSTGQTYRLLTESEWEYAARAGTMTAFSTGETILTDQANYNGNHTWGSGGKKGEYRAETLEVGSFRPNGFGLHDMQGNVMQWVEDCYVDTYKAAPTDGSAVVTPPCTYRVARGGAWGTFPWALRSAYRTFGPPDTRADNYGFRLARSLHP